MRPCRALKKCKMQAHSNLTLNTKREPSLASLFTQRLPMFTKIKKREHSWTRLNSWQISSSNSVSLSQCSTLLTTFAEVTLFLLLESTWILCLSSEGLTPIGRAVQTNSKKKKRKSTRTSTQPSFKSSMLQAQLALPIWPNQRHKMTKSFAST